MEITTIICAALIYWKSVVGLTVNKYYEEGSTAILICNKRAPNSSVQISWYGPTNYRRYSIGQKINPEINAEKQFRLNVTGNHTLGEYNLQISTFQQQDQGYYICLLIGSFEPNEVIRLSIKVVLRDAFIAPSGQVVIESSQRKQFNCSASSLPLPSIVWHLDSKNISENSNATINVSVTSVYEYIGTKDDNGKILYCTAESDGIKVKSVYVQLNVTYGPSTSQKIDPPNTSIEKRKGEDLDQIRCSADCNPDCQFQWIKGNGQVVVQGDTLSIQSLEKTDHGTYRCRAWNGIGETSINIMLTINYGPEYMNLLPNNSTYKLQEFTSLPAITCYTECRPNCFKYWIGPKNKVKQSNTLNIRNISRSHAGRYRCYANNTFSSSESNNVTIIVTCSPRISGDVSTGEQISVKDGEGLHITVTLIAFPQPDILWYFKNSSVLANNSFGSFEHTSYLYKPTVKQTDFGIYSMIASNTMGNIMFDVQVGSDRFPQSKTTTEFASTVFVVGFGAGSGVTFIVIIVVIIYVVIYKRHRQNQKDKTRIYEEANSRSGFGSLFYNLQITVHILSTIMRTNIYHELNQFSQESCSDLQEKKQNTYEDIKTYDNQACEREDRPKQTQQEAADSNTNFGRVYINIEI